MGADVRTDSAATPISFCCADITTLPNNIPRPSPHQTPKAHQRGRRDRTFQRRLGPVCPAIPRGSLPTPLHPNFHPWRIDTTRRPHHRRVRGRRGHHGRDSQWRQACQHKDDREQRQGCGRQGRGVGWWTWRSTWIKMGWRFTAGVRLRKGNPAVFRGTLEVRRINSNVHSTVLPIMPEQQLRSIQFSLHSISNPSSSCPSQGICIYALPTAAFNSCFS